MIKAYSMTSITKVNLPFHCTLVHKIQPKELELSKPVPSGKEPRVDY